MNMKYICDHDLHIHSHLSQCSSDKEQTIERIIQYAKDNNLKTICLTDHYWDEAVPGASNWYKLHGFKHISSVNPLPQVDGVKFLFGCETELDKDMTIGISKDRFKDFDFIIIPTTHLHMNGFTIKENDAGVEVRAKLWVKRLETVLNMDLPFCKVGIAHLTCSHFISSSKADYVSALDLIKNEDLEYLFQKAAGLGCGIELNLSESNFSDLERDSVFRIYRVAKKCGCKFYLGSDAHHPAKFEQAKSIFQQAVDLLELTEKDKFYPSLVQNEEA